MTNDPRFCYHSDESYVNEDRKFLLIRVVEDMPGYLIVAPYDTAEEAKSVADRLNGQLGLTRDDVLDIRSSSMAASRPDHTMFDAFVRVQFYVDHPEYDDPAPEEAASLLRTEIEGLGERRTDADVVEVLPTRVEIIICSNLQSGSNT